MPLPNCESYGKKKGVLALDWGSGDYIVKIHYFKIFSSAPGCYM